MLFQKVIGATSVAKDVEFISSSINYVNAASNTVTAPTGIQNGDLLVAYGMVEDNNRTVTLPSGFTSRAAITNALNNDGTLFIATKVASSESGNYTFTWSGASRRNTIAILVYRNATDDDRLVGSESAASSSTATAPSISPTTEGALIAFFAIRRSVTVTTAPSGMTQLAFLTGEVPTVAVYGITPNGTGATGDKTLVWSNPASNSGIQMQIYKG